MSASWPPTIASGGGCKFAVVDPATGRRSSTWRVSTAKNQDQVLLMELHTGRDWKVTLHNELGHVTGKPAWRIAMTSDAAKQQDVDRQVIDHWIPEAPEDGWIEGVGVLIPFCDLRPETQPLPPSVVQIPAAKGCDGFSVRCFLEDSGAIGISFPPGAPVAVLDRCTGGRLYVLATPAMFEERQYDAFEAFREQARAARSDTLRYPTDRFVAVVKMQRQRVLVDLTLNVH